jgi:hypothetical protein
MAERPLSPFWVYRWGYTMTLSILHRATGIALIAALLGLVVWLVSVSFGAASYAGAADLTGNSGQGADIAGGHRADLSLLQRPAPSGLGYRLGI